MLVNHPGGRQWSKPLIPEMCFNTQTGKTNDGGEGQLSNPGVAEDGTSRLVSCAQCFVRVHTSKFHTGVCLMMLRQGALTGGLPTRAHTFLVGSAGRLIQQPQRSKKKKNSNPHLFVNTAATRWRRCLSGRQHIEPGLYGFWSRMSRSSYIRSFSLKSLVFILLSFLFQVLLHFQTSHVT